MDERDDIRQHIIEATGVPGRYVPDLPNPFLAQEQWINTRTGETFTVEAKSGPSRTWRFGSLD